MNDFLTMCRAFEREDTTTLQGMIAALMKSGRAAWTVMYTAGACERFARMAGVDAALMKYAWEGMEMLNFHLIYNR